MSNTITETIQDEIPVWKEKSEKIKTVIISENKMSSELQFVVSRIELEFSEDIFESLTDENLLPEYAKSESTKEGIEKLNKVLKKNNVDEEVRNKIIEEYLLEIVKPGTKGNIRGRKFNKIIKKMIMKMELDKNTFDIQFEKKCDSWETSEIPDWYILEKDTGKVIIGMNQVDLWGGGTIK